MFDSLLGRKFTVKCKQSLKCTKARIYERRKKKQALLNFLKKDIADLLVINEDSNAFGRMDGIIVEMNQVACYDMIEKLCDHITSQLPTLQKQRECSEEATEAVATLIYAAARFSDLPELCDLRRAFTKRYGSAMESSVNQEFMEKISKKSFSKERKLKMMQEIANEFSVKWDSKDFGQKSPVPAILVQSKTDVEERDDKQWGSFNVTARSNSVAAADVKNKQSDLQPVVRTARKEAQFATNEKHVIPVKKVELDHNQDVKELHGASPPGLKAPTVSAKIPRAEDPTDHERQKVVQRSINNRAINPSPPYVRVKEQKDGVHGDKHHEDHCVWTIKPERVIQVNIIPPCVSDVKQPVSPANHNANLPINRTPPYLKPIANKTEHKESMVMDVAKEEPVEKPKPRSMRRNRHSIPSQQHQAEVQSMDADERIDQIVYGKRRGNRRGTRSFDTGNDEEDKVIDRLLLHYSSKDQPAQPDRLTKTKRDPMMSRDVKISEAKLDTEHSLTRVVSLPPERTSASDVNVPQASPSAYPNGGARVHPRLPDYDELAARFNALKNS